MALADRFVLNAAVVEVQYQKGMVFFDKCGSLMDRLSDALGPAFETNVPQMVHGELTNATERLIVRYGPKAFSVAQHWVRTPVRVEMVAPLAWDHVAEVLGVGRHATRFGVRFVFMWEVGDLPEAERRIGASRLFSETPDAIEAFGMPATRGWVVTSDGNEGTLRVAMNAAETEIKGGPLAADLVGVVPKVAIVLDLDYTPKGNSTNDPPFNLQKGRMKDFIRGSWERAKKTADFVHIRLAERAP